MDAVAKYLAAYKQIPGWLAIEDFLIFDRILGRQRPGDLLEIGAFKGASAILIGLHCRDGETFTVCDLFGGSADPANAVEVADTYPDLTRGEFERNYLAWLPELPTIIVKPSFVLADRMAADSCRFIHIDGSHLYEHVVADIRTAFQVGLPDAVVAFDDWRTKHAPGTHVAVMEPVIEGGLHVIAVTESKLYASPDAATASLLREDLTAWSRTGATVTSQVERIRGVDLPRIFPIPREEPLTWQAKIARRVNEWAYPR